MRGESNNQLDTGGYPMINIAIDGPSGAGKSTLAKAIAAKLGYIYVDTGALYRAIGLYVKEKGIELSQCERAVEFLDEIKLELLYKDGSQLVMLGGRDVSLDIRMPEISMYASGVSKIPAVREFLLDLQRSMAKKHNVIMDGRDIGTVILPDADVKIFLTASAEGRAKRRYKELLEKGVDTTLEAVLADMEARDKQDATREIAPAVAADDAIFFDNTEYGLEESLEKVLEIIYSKIGNKQ